MTFEQVVQGMIDESLLDTSTAFIGRITAYNKDEKTANVQPLTMTKAYGKAAKQRALLTGVPVAHNANYKLHYEYIGEPIFDYVAIRKYIEVGDLCVCIVCDRNISETKRGNVALPLAGHHDIQNAIVIGCL